MAAKTDSEFPSPLLQLLSDYYKISLLLGPPLAGGYAVYYYLNQNYAGVAGLIFFLVVDFYMLFQIFLKKKSLVSLSNIVVFAMFAANVIPLYTSTNYYEQLNWFIVFPFLYFNIVGYKNGVRWALVYYVTVGVDLCCIGR